MVFLGLVGRLRGTAGDCCSAKDQQIANQSQLAWVSDFRTFEMQAVNVTQHRPLAEGLGVADTFFTSLRGLIGKPRLRPGEGLWIVPCQSVHTLWMSFPIDVLFLDKGGVVIHLVENMKPFRISKHIPRARSVIELPSQTIRETRTRLGDRVEISGG